MLLFAFSFSMLDESKLSMLPIRSLMQSGCLVAVWVTNSDRLVEYTLNTLFVKWKLVFVSKWHWIKVFGHQLFVEML